MFFRMDCKRARLCSEWLLYKNILIKQHDLKKKTIPIYFVRRVSRYIYLMNHHLDMYNYRIITLERKCFETKSVSFVV